MESNTEEYYRFLGIDTKSKAFHGYKRAGLLDNIDEDYVKEVKRYWKKHYHINVDPLLHIAYMNYTGKKEPRLIHHKTSWHQIIPFFNDQQMNETYKDKNLYDKLIPTERSAITVLKRSHGLYFKDDDKCLDRTEVLNQLLSYEEDFIIKPSNTNNGIGIRKIYFRNDHLYINDGELDLQTMEDMYGADFTVQKVVEQHPIMAAPHPHSINTLRMVTFRWKNEIHYLLTFARFGANQNVLDNTSHGGVSMGVKDTGEFMGRALDRQFKVHYTHPTTGYPLKNMEPVPNFDKFKEFVKDLHKNILHHDLVSWDIVVGKDALPIFLEANFRGGTWFYQLLSERPLFGDMTEEVLQHIYKERNDKTSPRYKSYSKLQPTKKKLDEKISGLEKEIIQLKKERDLYKKKYNNVLESTSWRLTSPVRKLSGLIKKR